MSFKQRKDLRCCDLSNKLENKRIETECVENNEIVELHLSQETERMRAVEKDYNENNLARSLQDLQTSMLPDWESGKTSRYHEFMSITSNMLRTIGTNKTLYEKYHNQLKIN